jgi:Undecaprenyl-phosphate galactose phosphotransferase WbaP
MGTQVAFSQPASRLDEVARPPVVAHAWPAATSLVLLGADVLAMLAARPLAMALWRCFHSAAGLPMFLDFWESLGLFALTYAVLGMYSGGTLGAVEELRRAVLGVAFVCLLLTAWPFLLRHTGSYSRGMAVLPGCFTAVLVPLARAVARRLFSSRRWWGVPVIVLGSGDIAHFLIERLRHHPHMGFKPVACLDNPVALDNNAGKPRACAGVPVAGPLSAARELAKSLKIRHALVAVPGVARPDLVWMLDDWGTVFRHVILIPDLSGISSLWVSTRDLGGVLGLELRQNLLVPLNRCTKRAIDIVAALVIGIAALPVLAGAALWIKFGSQGSVFFRQERGGERGRTIQVPKLRTMHPDAEALLMRVLSESPEIRAEWACHYKLKRDPRILPGVGRFLRRTSLDELPQLWSVLKGDMSLVGPRPFPRYHLKEFDPRFRALRNRVKPGLTGLWQVSGRADGDLDLQETLDTYYIRNWSLWLDLYILARTARAVFLPRGAY